jgi:hypothetical protein
MAVEEPDFDGLSTKFLPPDSQLSTPTPVAPLKKKQRSLPPAKIDVVVKRTPEDFIHHIVMWNPLWLKQQG